MKLKSTYQNLIEWGRENQNNLLISTVLILGFLIGLGLGILFSSNNPSQIIIDRDAKIVTPETLLKTKTRNSNDTFQNGNFVASINGKAYYPTDCKAAEKIKEENRIWFETTAEAESQGYQPAKNCPGF